MCLYICSTTLKLLPIKKLHTSILNEKKRIMILYIALLQKMFNISVKLKIPNIETVYYSIYMSSNYSISLYFRFNRKCLNETIRFSRPHTSNIMTCSLYTGIMNKQFLSADLPRKISMAGCARLHVNVVFGDRT